MAADLQTKLNAREKNPMAFKYENVVPWGRNFDEYMRMFDLQPEDLRKRIIGCGDGPASFNAVANQKGGHVTSVDPIYVFTKAEIEKKSKKPIRR